MWFDLAVSNSWGVLGRSWSGVLATRVESTGFGSGEVWSVGGVALASGLSSILDVVVVFVARMLV